MMNEFITFNARAFFVWKLDRLYRIYVARDELFFIRIGGQGGWETGVSGGLHANPFGLILLPLVSLFAKRAEKKTEKKIAAFDQKNPQVLLHNHKHNFRISSPDFLSSSIEPPTLFKAHGYHFGQWKFNSRNKGKMNLQFEKLEDMVTALNTLPGLLGTALQIKGRWNPAKGRFEKLPQ